jgi:hypothetical protein
VSSVEPEKLGSKASFQPAGTVSTDGGAAAAAWVGVEVAFAVLLAFGVGVGFAVFLAFADLLAFADGEGFADALVDVVAFVNPVALAGPDEPPFSTTTATRATASTITPPRMPDTMRALRIEAVGWA